MNEKCLQQGISGCSSSFNIKLCNSSSAAQLTPLSTINPCAHQSRPLSPHLQGTVREAYQQHIAQHCILIDEAVELLFQPVPGLDSLQNGHNVQLTPLQALVLCCYCLRLPGWCRLRLLFAKLTILRQSNCAATTSSSATQSMGCRHSLRLWCCTWCS